MLGYEETLEAKGSSGFHPSLTPKFGVRIGDGGPRPPFPHSCKYCQERAHRMCARARTQQQPVVLEVDVVHQQQPRAAHNQKKSRAAPRLRQAPRRVPCRAQQHAIRCNHAAALHMPQRETGSA